MMEAIEIFHAENVLLPRRHASYAKMQADSKTVDCKQLTRLSGSRFREDLEIPWIKSLEIRNEEEAWLPFESVHTDFSRPRHAGSGCFLCSSTGLASGNHLLEAIIHGICEVIERDAMTLWGFSSPASRAATRIAIKSVDSPLIAECVEKIARAGLELSLSDITSEFGVAAVHASITDPDYGEPGHMLVAAGSGCHPCRDIAVLRAVTEAAQSRLTVIAGVRDNLRQSDFVLSKADESPHVSERSRQERATRNYKDISNHTADNFQDTLQWLMERLDHYPVFVVDLSRRDFGVPVVRVVIPGLEDGIDTPGYIPGGRVLMRLVESMRSEE